MTHHSASNRCSAFAAASIVRYWARTFDVWHTTNAAYAWLALETQRAFVTVHGNDFLRPYFPVGRLDLPSRWRLPLGSNLDGWVGNLLTERS